MRKSGIWLAAALLASGSAALAAPAKPESRPFRLCVLDQAAIVRSSRLARDMGQRFQQVRQQAQAKLEDDRRTLEADARALESLRGSIPPAVARTRDADIAQRRLQLKARGEQTNRNLGALDGQLTANVAQLSEPITRAVETERGCSMLVARDTILHLGDTSLDITSAVLERMNAAPAAAPGRTPGTEEKGR